MTEINPEWVEAAAMAAWNESAASRFTRWEHATSRSQSVYRREAAAALAAVVPAIQAEALREAADRTDLSASYQGWLSGSAEHHNAEGAAETWLRAEANRIGAQL